MTTTYLPNRVLETTSGTAHLTTDGTETLCHSGGKLTGRTVANAAAFATCSKCRKAEGMTYMVGGSSRPEFNTGRRVFGR